MEYSGDIGEEIVHNFFDTNFSEILSFRNPKTKSNVQIADIIVWLNRYIFLVEVKTFVSSEYTIDNWANNRINESVEQLNNNYNRILSNEEIFLNNKYYHVKLDCEGLSEIIGIIVLVHEGDCNIEPSNVCKKIYDYDLPIHAFSWNQISQIGTEINTIPDLKYYFQDRIYFVKKNDIPLDKELDAIGLYKIGNNSFPTGSIDFRDSKYWQKYINSMSEERARRDKHNEQSGWLDRLGTIFTDNRKLFHNLPIGLHFTWVFAILSRRERASIGMKFETVQDRFLKGKQSRQFAIFIPGSGHWVIFYYSKHKPEEQQKILIKLVEQKLIQLKEDENFQYAVFGIGIQVSKLCPPRILRISNAMIIGVDEIIGKYSEQDVLDAKRNWGDKQIYKIEEFPSG